VTAIEIPLPWLMSWNYFSTPLSDMNTPLMGKSLFCATCGPYVADFGYDTSVKGWAYSLQISDGPFGDKPNLIDQHGIDREA
jgi:hypothetical protein